MGRAQVQFSAEFAADTSVAEANVKRYAELVKATSGALGGAERAAKQSFQEQRSQLVATGASTGQLNALTMKYNQTLYAIGNTAKQLGQTLQDTSRGAVSSESAKAQAVDLTNKELQRQIAIVEELAAANSKSSHEAVSGVQATSAAIRGIEGSGGIRAVENFISKTLGLGPAMQAIFPLIGGAMFAEMLVEVGEKLYEFRESGVNAGKAIRDAYDELTETTHKHGVELDLVNDKLDTQLAKINHKPANLLKTALDEDRKAAYDLTEELNRATTAEASLMKEKAVSGLKSLGMSLLGYNVADTTDQQRLITEQNGNLRRMNKAGDDALDHADPKNAEAVRQQDRINRQREYTKAIGETQKALDAIYKNQREGKGMDYSPQTSLMEGHLDELQGQLHNLNAGYAAGDKQRKVTQAEEAKQAARDGESAARKALEAQKKAAEEQRKQWELDDAEEAQQGKLSAAQTHAIWIARENATKIGSENYLLAEKHAFESLKQINEEQHKQLDEKLKMERQFSDADHKRTVGVLDKSNAYDTKGIIDQQTSLKALLDAQRENTYQQGLATAQQQASLGTISKYDEAVKIQALHTEEYAAQLRELQEALAAVSGTDNQAQAQRNTLQKQINDVQSRAAIESMKDSATIAGETWYGALKNANARWVQDSQDVAKQVADIYSSAINGVNADIVKFAQDAGSKNHRHAGRELKNDLGGTARGLGGQFANMGLKSAESSILGKFGLGGKADGTKSNPFFVVSASNLPVTGPGSPMSTLADRISSGFQGSNASSSGGGLSGLLGGIASFGGFFADGGYMPSGKSYIVGERGPEVFTPGGSGFVTPNHALKDSTTHHWHIAVDARGASNPAEVEAAAHRAVREAVPGIIAAAVQAPRDMQSRMPSSKR